MFGLNMNRVIFSSTSQTNDNITVCSKDVNLVVLDCC